FFVPQLDAGSNPVIDPSTGDDALAQNNASASGTWTPIDPRDPPNQPIIVDPPGPEHTLTVKSLAIQKTSSLVVDQGQAGPTPGDTIQYTVPFQVSDYFAFTNLVIDDLLGDGPHFDAAFGATLQVDGNGFVLPTSAFAGSNYTVAQNFTGAIANPPT